MNKGKRSLGFSPKQRQTGESKLLNSLQKSLIDINTPYLLIHNSFGGMMRVTIYQ
jgi:hypothetical protein